MSIMTAKELVLALACSRCWKGSQMPAFLLLHLGVGWCNAIIHRH